MIVIMSETVVAEFLSMGSRERTITPGEHLFHRGDMVSHMHLVSKGRVDLIRHSEDGRVIVLQRARPGEVLAEASLFAEQYHCDAVAGTLASVFCISKRKFRDRLRTDPDFAEMWTAHLGQEIQAMRFRSEVLSLQTVAARLDAWLAWYDAMPARGEWKQLAHQIGVSPEALYREMAKRRGPNGAI